MGLVMLSRQFMESNRSTREEYCIDFISSWDLSVVVLGFRSSASVSVSVSKWFITEVRHRG